MMFKNAIYINTHYKVKPLKCLLCFVFAYKCGTMERFYSLTGNRENRACYQYGDADDPDIRDMYIPSTQTPVKVVRLYFHGFSYEDGSGSTLNENILNSQMNYLNEVYELINSWTNEDRQYLYENVYQYGLSTKFKKGRVLDIAKKLIKISKRGLKNRNFLSPAGYDETKYLKPIEKNIDRNCSPADFLIEKFNNQWGKSISPIYEENIF